MPSNGMRMVFPPFTGAVGNTEDTSVFSFGFKTCGPDSVLLFPGNGTLFSKALMFERFGIMKFAEFLDVIG